MGLLRVRTSGAWVDTEATGSVRVSGTSVPFGPSGVAYEGLTFPLGPTLTNGNDSGQDYHMGIRFAVLASSLCYGVRWVRTPDSVALPPTGGEWLAEIWQVDTEAKIAEKAFVPTASTDNFDILFDDPVALIASPQLYTVSIFTEDYVYRNSGGVEIESPSGNIIADQGRLAATTNPDAYPSGNQVAWYFVSPLIGV